MEEALDLSFDRLPMMMMMMPYKIYIYIYIYLICDVQKQSLNRHLRIQEAEAPRISGQSAQVARLWYVRCVVTHNLCEQLRSLTKRDTSCEMSLSTATLVSPTVK